MGKEWIVTGNVKFSVTEYCFCEHCQGHSKSLKPRDVDLRISQDQVDRASRYLIHPEKYDLVKVAAELHLLTSEGDDANDYEPEGFTWKNYQATEREVGIDEELRRQGVPDLFSLIEETTNA